MDRFLRVFLVLSCLMLAVQGLTVGTLNETVTRSSCGTDRACFSTPADCDPTTNSACLLVSTRSSSSGLDFELRGESSGYIAVALSVDTTAGGNDKTYICANSNGTATFFFALLNNNTLEIQNDTTSISNVSASVNSTTIQCVFAVTGLNASMSRSADNTFAVVLATGTLSSDGTPSTPTVKTVTALLDLSNPSSSNTATVTTAPNVTTDANATTAATTTTTTATTTTVSGANIGLQHSLSQALLILFGVLAISLL
ncbi:putative ferric-chelate reductase 1 isoform X2 [Clupea harengus]|uniref:Ferric-chelate reductase 1 isoform X2 n=1 Tax=Clupea harengus TaxID=7950 RepID=A0A6P8GNI7_CLUHA|nr:putative ferric-chelate reductase 1 isoform X2 [Clupea harengus]